MKRFISVVLLVCAALGGMAQGFVDGSWEGLLTVGKNSTLRIVFNFKDEGKTVTLDSPDQGGYDIAGKVKYNSGDSVNITVARLAVRFAGSVKNGELSGIFRQGIAKMPLQLSRKESIRRRPQTPQPPFPYSTEDVSFTSAGAGAGNATLAGTLTLPEKPLKSHPVVLMVTGSGLQNRDEEVFGHKPFAVIADYLARNGIASLRYDDRGTAASTGDVAKATTHDFAADAAAGVEFLRQGSRFGKVGVLGHSEGATISFMIPSDFIVAIGAPALRGDSILRYQSAQAMAAQGLDKPTIDEYGEALTRFYQSIAEKGAGYTAEHLDEICGWPDDPTHNSLKANLKQIAASNNAWIFTFASMSPARYITALGDKPALVLYGEKDVQVPPALNEAPMRAMAPKADVRVYPGLNHIMQHAVTGAVTEYGDIEETISPEVLEAIASFISKQ